MCTGGSPNAGPLNCARCCVRRPTTPPAPSIRCTPTSPSKCAKHGYKRAAIAVAHRLCRIMFAMLRHGRDFDVSKLGIEVGPFAHTSVKPYRLKLVPRRRALRAAETRA